MITSTIRKKHYIGIRSTPHILDITYDGAKDERIKGKDKKRFVKAMRNYYKRLKIEEE